MPRLFRRKLPLVIMALTLGLSGYVGYEGFLLGAEARAFEAGRYEEAARLAGPVKLLRGPLAAQLQRQVGELEGRGVGASELPLLELTGTLTGSAALKERLAVAKLLLAAPSALKVETVNVSYQSPRAEAEPEAAPERFRQEPADGDESPWGETFQLLRLDPGVDDWAPIDEGFAGALGASFELAKDGRHLLVAREQTLELIDLEGGAARPLTIEGPPEFVALNPAVGLATPTVAYSIASEAGDALHLHENGTTRRLYPPSGAQLLPWLSFSWAPDGRSLLLRWEAEAPEGGKTVTEIVWLRLDGTVGLEATLEAPIKDVDVTWAPSPDGKRMILALDAGHWLWDADENAARPLLDLAGLWGWGPDSRKLAGLDQGRLFILDVDAPEQRMQQAEGALPKLLAGDPDDVRWEGDRLQFTGLTTDGENGPVKEAIVEVLLGLR